MKIYLYGGSCRIQSLVYTTTMVRSFNHRATVLGFRITLKL